MDQETYIGWSSVPRGMKVRLDDFHTGWVHNDEIKAAGKKTAKKRALDILQKNRVSLICCSWPVLDR